MIYVNENRGSLPPLMFEMQGISGGYTTPTIFPVDDEAYLTKYLSKPVLVTDSSNKSFMASPIPSAKLYVCPEMQADVNTSQQWSVYSYRYNMFLGGNDKFKKQAAYGGGWTSLLPNLPWKLSQLPDTSRMALFGEGATPNGNLTVGNFGSQDGGLALDSSPGAGSNGLYNHIPRYSVHLHRQIAIVNGLGGFTNIGYCDGSVRSVPWKVIFTSANLPFPDTWIVPYQAGNRAGWSAATDKLYH